MDIDVRQAAADEYADIIDLLTRQLQEHNIPTSIEELESAVTGVFSDPSRGALLLALEGETPVGIAYLSYTWALEHGGKTAWLEELYVLPPYRSKGAGQMMLEEVMEFAVANGCRAMDLEVATGHERAESLYRRNDFIPHERKRWYKKL